MSPLPAQLADHWWQRPGRRPGRGEYHWHLLFRDQPQVRAAAAAAQRRLAGFPGLDLVPLQWLHLTTLSCGFADQVPGPQLKSMVDTARQLLAGDEPIPVRLGRVLYHPEAVTLAVEPADALAPVLSAVSIAAREAGLTGRPGTDPWVPHISVAYSNGTGPAGPVIEALGLRLPEVAATVTSATLVAQSQVGHSWQWQVAADVRLGPAA